MKNVALIALFLIAGCQTQRVRQISSVELDTIGNSLATLQTGYEMCACNIAYMHVAAYKASRPVMEQVPGSGLRIARIITDMSQGPAVQTGRELDLMIDGAGFFVVRTEDSGNMYSRGGVFALNSHREIVTISHGGQRLEPAIVVPEDAMRLLISESGRVCVVRTGSVEPEEIGQVQLACFPSAECLKSINGGVFVETPDSGAPILSEPGLGACGVIRQGMYEGSNVNMITEQITAMRIEQQYGALVRLVLPGNTPSLVAAGTR